MVDGVDMFTSLLSTFHSLATSSLTCLEKLQSGLVKRLFWSSCDAIALALTGHLSGLDAVLPDVRAVDSVPSFSAGVCEVNGFHCLYPTFLALLIQALDQGVSCGFRPLTGCCGCVGVHTAIGILRPSTECRSSDSHGELIAWLHWLACCRMPYKRCPSLYFPMVVGSKWLCW